MELLHLLLEKEPQFKKEKEKILGIPYYIVLPLKVMMKL